MKKLESGRSMVEMLGVLAIIGVLSVGGIAGYSLGMRRHRANGIADVASKYAVVAYNQCQQKLMNGEIDGSTVNGTITKGCHGEEDVISFENAGVGNKPAGVNSIARPYVIMNGEGEDTVVVSVIFDDDKLCQAAGSIAGTGCYQYAGDSMVEFRIKQN